MKHMKHWQDPANAVIGAWLVMSPWMFGFSNLGAATLNALVSGLLILGLALWVLGIDKDWGFGHDRPAH